MERLNDNGLTWKQWRRAAWPADVDPPDDHASWVAWWEGEDPTDWRASADAAKENAS